MNPKFCSLSCSAKKQHADGRAFIRPVKVAACNNCGLITRNPKFCSRSCAAKMNNLGVRRYGGSPLKCLHCGTSQKRGEAKYCSHSCQAQYRYAKQIRQWKSGELTGLQLSGVVTVWLKRYLREQQGNICALCGWNKVNPSTGTVPLVADHIDGNWENNMEENLRLLCGACDSIQPTYKGLNRGKGRTWRRKIS